jgi:anti-anti-sigma regulatory factor
VTPGAAQSALGVPQAVTVTRIGTQVVVRLSGEIGDRQATDLQAAVEEISAIALRRVVIDLDDVGTVEGAGVDFIQVLHQRWSVRLLNTPPCLRGKLPRQAPLT